MRLLIADDDQLFSAAFRTVLELQPDFDVVGIAKNGEMAIAMVKDLAPDIVLMDVQMPVMDGREATKIICERFPTVKVLVLTTFENDEYVLDSIQAGAIGYLLKAQMLPEPLAESIRLAGQGISQIAPGMLNKLMDRRPIWKSSRAKLPEPGIQELTPREQEVFQLLAEGLTNREIADRLCISEGTVKTHVKHLFERLGCDNRTQAGIIAASLLMKEV